MKIDPVTAGSCIASDANCSLAAPILSDWGVEALSQTLFNFVGDLNYAHVQPNGQYHYHAIPEEFFEKLNKGTEVTLLTAALF